MAKGNLLDRVLSGSGKQVVLSGALDEEAIGWERWLRLMGPGTFTAPFAKHQRHYWDWFWSVLMRRKRGEFIPLEEWVYLATWARGTGKSSSVEWATIAEGAILGAGFVLYISVNQELSDGHLMAIRSRLESSETAKFYPHMANPKVGRYGQRFGWRQDTLITESGWAIASFGLDTGMRGGKYLDQRPSLIVLDDIDELHDTPAAVTKRIEVMSRSIFPSGTANTVVLGAQNLIHRHSAFNQIVTGRVDLLQDRIQAEVVPAIRNLKIEQVDGRNLITEGEAIWPEGLTIEDAQKALSKSGLEAFMAEYQHDFAASLEGLILPEFDPNVHVISWSEFYSVYKLKVIPEHWQKEIGLDWGSTGLSAHPTAVSFIATSAEDSTLPGLTFLYAGLTFDEGVIADQVAEAIIEITGRDPEDYSRAALGNFRRWTMSHEAKSERDTFRRQYGLPFQPCRAERRGGISMLRHFMKVDYKLYHPFKPGRKGACYHYWIVDDHQLVEAKKQGFRPDGVREPRDLGLHRWREEVIDWRWRPQDVGAAGLVQEVPVAYRDDAMASLRYLAAYWFPPVEPLSKFETKERLLPSGVRFANMPTEPTAREEFEFARWIHECRLQKRNEMLKDRK